MTLEQATKIKQDYGSFLELTNGNLMLLFLGNIPESLLPYPKDFIKEALNIFIEYFSNRKNNEAIEVAQDAMTFLDMYVEDTKAMEGIKGRLNDKEYLGKVLPELKNVQKEHLKTLLD